MEEGGERREQGEQGGGRESYQRFEEEMGSKLKMS